MHPLRLDDAGSCCAQVLRELEVTWAAMEFVHEVHPTRGVTMLKTGEELIETLEENQVKSRHSSSARSTAVKIHEVHVLVV